MTGSFSPNPRIEERLDQLLDDVSAGLDSRETSDPELADFAALATAIRNDDDVEWPDASFPVHLADTLYEELGKPAVSTLNGHASALPWDDDSSKSRHTGAISPPSAQMPELIGKRGWPGTRRVLGIAAAIAGFALLTLILVAIFRGFEDNDAPALGGSEENHPPQLAVTMQTDPVNGNPEIYLVSLDGSEPVNLTNNPANDTFPAWSPDGTRLAFVSDRGGTDALYIMDADGSNLAELYGPSEADDLYLRNPVWSPDGDSIALLQFDRGDVPGGSGSRAVVVDVENGERYLIRLVEDYAAPGFDERPAWSPDSRWLIFEAFSDDDSQLFVADIDAPPSDRRGLQITDRISGNAAGWSKSDEIAITDGSEVKIVDFDSNTSSFVETRQISTEAAGSAGNPSWSPDGSLIAVTAGDFGGQSVWIVNVDDSTLSEIPDSTTGVYPVWSDTNQLAYLRAGMVFAAESTGYELVIFEPETGTVTHQFDTGFSGPLMSPPAWRPGGTPANIDEDSQPPPTETPATPPAAATATAIANQELVPPQADLQFDSSTIEGKLGSYSWQFGDQDQTIGSVVYRHMPDVIGVDPVDLNSTLSILIHGDEYTRPPSSVVMRVHQVDVTTVAPGESPDAISGSVIYRSEMRDEPLVTMTADDPMRPEFEPDLPAGNYVLFVEATWGPHPQTGRDIFVTWVFDVVDSSAAPFSEIPEVQRAVQVVRDFLDEPNAELIVDEVEESYGWRVAHLSRLVPGVNDSNDRYDQFTVDLDHEANFSAVLVSSSAAGQPSNPVSEEQARTIAEDFYLQHDIFDGSLTWVDSPRYASLGMTERLYGFRWQLQREGVWLPTLVQIVVSSETGLVTGYSRFDQPYGGPLAPVLSEAEASQIAVGRIFDDPGLAGATIDKVRLTVAVDGLGYAVASGQAIPGAEPEWRLAWEFSLVDLPGPNAEDMIWIDAANGEPLVPVSSD